MTFNQETDEWSFLEVDIQYPENLSEHLNNLQFLPEKNENMKVQKAKKKVKKLVTNLHYKIEYVIHIRNLKQELNHGLIFEKSS